jgi:polygalacturonase
LDECRGEAVILKARGDNNVFVTSHIEVDSTTLVVDKDVWLVASRNADLYQETGNCGKPGLTDSGACLDFIQVRGTSPRIMGTGHIDGQGGEPLVGQDYSWWQLSEALRDINGSIGNPQLINLERGTTGFVLHGVHLHDAAKFHVKITASPEDGICDTWGKGYTVWGITILTHSGPASSSAVL